MRFQDRAALVTGATGGIGQAICQRLAADGARVAVHTAHHAEEARKLAGELPGNGHVSLVADLLDADEARDLVTGVLDQLGRIDVLVNNAGTYEEHPVGGVPYDEWQDLWTRTLTLNLVAPANLSFWTAKTMREHGGGAIVNVSSRGAFRGEPEAPAYGASKAGLNSLTQSLAKALGGDGIRVTAVAPGFVETPMVDGILDGPRGASIRHQSPLGRVATPEEVAAAVAFLASDECPFATGAILDVNGASYLRT